MTRAIDWLNALLQDYFNISIPDIHATDIIEMIIIAIFLYEILKWVKSTRAWILLRGIMVIAGFFILAALFQMSVILWLGEIGRAHV